MKDIKKYINLIEDDRVIVGPWAGSKKSSLNPSNRAKRFAIAKKLEEVVKRLVLRIQNNDKDLALLKINLNVIETYVRKIRETLKDEK